MITTRATWVLLLAAGVLGLVAGAPAPPGEVAAPIDAPPARPAFMVERLQAQAVATGLPARWTALAAPALGRVGVAAAVLEGGTAVSLAGAERFPMQSVYKFPIAMAALAQVDAGRLRLDQRIAITPGDFAGGVSPIRDAHPHGTTLPLEEVLHSAVSFSDNTASDVALAAVGGPAAVTAFLRGLDIDGVTVATSEKAMFAAHDVQYRNWATPDGMLALLRAFHAGRGLTTASRDRLRAWMVDTPTGPRRLKGALPPGTEVAHKTGTSGTTNGVTAATNDVGIVTLPDGRHLAIAVFVSDARGDEAAREGAIAGAARAAWDAWVTGR